MNVRRIVATVGALFLALSMVSPAQASIAGQSTLAGGVKTAVKVGAKCTKLNAKAKVGSVQLICKRVSGKLLWAKATPSAECKKYRTEYATQSAAYAEIVKQIPILRSQLVGLTGTEATDLAARIDGLEDIIKTLAPVVKKTKALVDDICAVS